METRKKCYIICGSEDILNLTDNQIKELNKETLISVNKAFMLHYEGSRNEYNLPEKFKSIKEFEYCVFNDYSFLHTLKIFNLKTKTIFITNKNTFFYYLDNHNLNLYHTNLMIKFYNINKNKQFDLNKCELTKGTSSVILALNFALLKGFEDIHFVGLTLSGDHFFKSANKIKTYQSNLIKPFFNKTREFLNNLEIPDNIRLFTDSKKTNVNGINFKEI